MRQMQTSTQTTEHETDGAALLDEILADVVAAGKDTSALDRGSRAALLTGLARRLGLNPLSGAVMFLRTQGRETLYVTKSGTDQIAARERLRRETVRGPEVVAIEGRKVVLCQVRATHPDGRSEVSTATLALADPVNDLMKCETKAKRRATLSVCGLGLLAEDEIETIQGAERVEAPTPPRPITRATIESVGIEQRGRLAPPPETEDEDEGPAPPPAPRPLTDDECEALCGALGVADAATIEGAVTDARSEYPRASTEQRARLTAAVVAARGRLAPPPTPPEDEPPQRPRGRRPRRDAGEHVAVAAPPVADAAPAGDAPAAWRSSLDGVREHLAAIRALPHLEASARRHGRGLEPEAIALYAERLVALAGDDHSGAWLSTRAATERVTRWAVEGPVVRHPAGVRRAA